MEIVYTIITIAVVLAVCAFIYKGLPFRSVGESKPAFCLFPKYEVTICWREPQPEMASMEAMLSKYGFTAVSIDDRKAVFDRGKLLGDFSVKLLKLRCVVEAPKDGESRLTLQARWMIAFDTGDLWRFTTELKQKLESEPV